MDLCCDKEFVSGDTAFLDGYPNLALVAVSFGAVNVIDAQLYGCFDRIDRSSTNASTTVAFVKCSAS